MGETLELGGISAVIAERKTVLVTSKPEKCRTEKLRFFSRCQMTPRQIIPRPTQDRQGSWIKNQDPGSIRSVFEVSYYGKITQDNALTSLVFERWYLSSVFWKFSCCYQFDKNNHIYILMKKFFQIRHRKCQVFRQRKVRTKSHILISSSATITNKKSSPSIIIWCQTIFLMLKILANSIRLFLFILFYFIPFQSFIWNLFEQTLVIFNFDDVGV